MPHTKARCFPTQPTMSRKENGRNIANHLDSINCTPLQERRNHRFVYCPLFGTDHPLRFPAIRRARRAFPWLTRRLTWLKVSSRRTPALNCDFSNLLHSLHIRNCQHRSRVLRLHCCTLHRCALNPLHHFIQSTSNIETYIPFRPHSKWLSHRLAWLWGPEWPLFQYRLKIQPRLF